MKTTRVLQTNITETTVKEVANILNTSSETRVAICNANTLVRCCKNSQLKDVVDNFTIKTPDMCCADTLRGVDRGGGNASAGRE